MRTMAIMFRLLMLAVLAMLSLTSIPQAHAHVDVGELIKKEFQVIEPVVKQYLNDWQAEREREDKRPMSLRRFTRVWANDHKEEWGEIVKAKGKRYVKGIAGEWLKQTRSKVTGPFKRILNLATPIVKTAVEEFKIAKKANQNLKLRDFLMTYGVKAGQKVAQDLAIQGGNWCVKAASEWIEASENKLIKQVAGKAGDFIEEFVEAANAEGVTMNNPKQLLAFAVKYMSDPTNHGNWQLALIRMGQNQLEKRAKGIFGRLGNRKVNAKDITEETVIHAFDVEKDFKLVDEEEESEGLAEAGSDSDSDETN
jgi:hypothetical protein